MTRGLVRTVHVSRAGETSAPAIPPVVLLWPDGSPCWEANLYLCRLASGRPSERSVRTYASELSPVVIFLSQDRRSWFDLDDDAMKALALALKTEQRDGVRRRAPQHVNRILHRTLDVLACLQDLFVCDPPLIGALGANVTIDTRGEPGRWGRRRRWVDHEAFLPPGVLRRVLPLSRPVLRALLEACDVAFARRPVRERTRSVIKLVADSGCRREEATWVTTRDIDNALRDPRGLLLLKTVKSPLGSRKVPIPKATLLALAAYIRGPRALLIDGLLRRGTIAQDPGWLFLNHHGRRLTPISISHSLRTLRRAAGISERATIHMLRHRWITLQLVHRIAAYPDRPFTAEIAITVLTQLASLSGHRSIESLWTYVDLAFDEAGVWALGAAQAERRSNLSALERELEAIAKEIRATSPRRGITDELIERFEAVLLTLRSVDSTPAALPCEQVSAHSVGRRARRP